MRINRAALSHGLFPVLVSGLMAACSQLPDTPPKNHSARLDLGKISVEQKASELEEDWYKKAVFAEIYVRGFKDSDGDGIGDIQGLTSKLDYLKDLGIGGIWLMPVMLSQDRDHGYAVTDYRQLEKDYGTMGDFRIFLAEAHKRGIGVIIDYVMNHSAYANPLFLDSLHPASDKRDWYIWSDSAKEWPRWDGQNTWHPAKYGYYYAIFWGQMPDFNLKNQAVIDYHHSNMRFWLNLGVDGFRFDAAGTFVENGADAMMGQPESITTINNAVKIVREYDNRFVVCEDPDTPLRVSEDDACGTAFYFGLHKAMMSTVKEGAVSEDFADYLIDGQRERVATFLTNHDGFAGDRIIKQVNGDLYKYRLAAGTLMTLPGIPFIYYGDEIGIGHTEGKGGDHR